MPYLAALAVALVADLCISRGSLRGMPEWFNRTWPVPFEWAHVAQHVLFVGSYQYDEFNTAFWSLTQEMRISLAFPMLLPFIARFRTTGQIMFVACALTLGAVLAAGLPGMSFGSLRYTGLYAGLFLVGSLLSQHAGLLAAWYRRSSRALQCLFWSLSALFFFDADIFYSPILRLLGHSVNTGTDLCIAAGGFGLLVGAIASPRAGRFLKQPFPSWLGRISYSLYLVHATVLFALVRFSPTLPRLYVLGLYISGALTAAVVFYRMVERPSTEWSRRSVRVVRHEKKRLEDLLPHVSV